MKAGVRLRREETALLVVDVQERLVPAMDPELRGTMLRQVPLLARAARRLRVPVLLTEQYPKGLGSTVAEVREVVGSLEPIAKVTFSCCGAEGLVERLRETGARAVVVVGLETHVCVLMTVLDLLAEGWTVHVVADATASRSARHWRIALDLLHAQGAVVTTTETVVFQLLGRADSDDFRALAPLLK